MRSVFYTRRVKPVECFQLPPDDNLTVHYPAWFIAALRNGRIKAEGSDVHVPVLFASVRTAPGSWIVRIPGYGTNAVADTYEVYNEDAFKALFEPVPEAVVDRVHA